MPRRAAHRARGPRRIRSRWPRTRQGSRARTVSGLRAARGGQTDARCSPRTHSKSVPPARRRSRRWPRCSPHDRGSSAVPGAAPHSGHRSAPHGTRRCRHRRLRRWREPMAARPEVPGLRCPTSGRTTAWPAYAGPSMWTNRCSLTPPCKRSVEGHERARPGEAERRRTSAAVGQRHLVSGRRSRAPNTRSSS